MARFAEDSDTDSYKDSYLDPTYSYYGDSDPDANLDTGEELIGDSDPDANSDTGEELIGYSDPDANSDTGEEFFGLMFTNSSSDEEETCVQNSDVEEKIFYTPISGRSRFLSIKEAEVKSMSFMQNNYSERLSIDEGNSEEDQLKTTRRLKPEKKLKIQKRGFKRQQTDERGSPKKNVSSGKTQSPTATSKTQRPSRQLSAASSIAKDEEDQLKTKPLKPEKKLKSQKRGFKRRQTDERGSPKRKRKFKERTVSETAIGIEIEHQVNIPT